MDLETAICVLAITIAFGLPLAVQPLVVSIRNITLLKNKNKKLDRATHNLNFGCISGCGTGVIGLVLSLVNEHLNVFNSVLDIAVVIFTGLALVSIINNLFFVLSIWKVLRNTLK